MKLKKLIASISLLLLIIGAIFYAKVKVDYRGGHEGLFVLRGEGKKWLAITDDLYHFESPRLLWSIQSPSHWGGAQSKYSCTPTDKPCTVYEWNEENGRGFIKTYYPDGKKLHVNLGRFISAVTNREVSGLFIGGGLHAGDPDESQYNNNKTGMSYFDGSRYFHIWCNANEGFLDVSNNPSSPSTWKYISSKVLESSARQLTIISKHSTVVNGEPIYFERLMTYKTGDTFLTLKTSFRNVGKSPIVIKYTYGDEPWVGNYDTFSKGNVGWHRQGIIYTEAAVDTSVNNYVGLFDHGNPLAGESHDFTGKANFLEWDPAKRPDTVYFSNQFGLFAPAEQKVPLDSYKTRVVNLEWGPMILAPKQFFSFTLRVGMANNDPKTGLPVKPDTSRH